MSRGVAFPALLRSEWTKLRSVRSTWWSSAVYVVVVGAFSWLAAAVTDRAPTAAVAVGTALTGFGFGQVVLVVLGVLVGAGEHTTGMALTSYAAVPRRTRLQLARTVVVAVHVTVLTAVLASCSRVRRGTAAYEASAMPVVCSPAPTRTPRTTSTTWPKPNPVSAVETATPAAGARSVTAAASQLNAPTTTT